MEFHIPYLKMLKEMGWETAVAARNDFDDPAECVIPYCDTYYDIPFERNPLKPGNIKAYKMLKAVIDEGNYDIIHCHTPVGAMLTRLAAQDARKKGSKVFYTAHGFHFYKGAPLINWLAYYPVEKWLARKTDVLITINKEDFNRAKNFKAGKVVYVPGVGIDINKFSKRIGNRQEKRAELSLQDTDFVLLSVGELISRKNHTIVLEALAELKKAGKLNSIQYLICGRGVLEAELKEKAVSLGISDHVHFLGYRNDVSEICNAADLFVFMSLQEGLPVALMEAMACGLPVICSDIRGNTDLVESGKNGEIVGNTAIAVADAIERLRKDSALCHQYAQATVATIKHFDLSSIETEVRDIYTDEVTEIPWGGGVKPEYLITAINHQVLKRNLGIPLDATVLLSVGEVNINKNHKVVIEALPELKDCWYVLCGRGPLMDEHRKLAENLGVSDRFVMTGYRTDVADFYSMADLFVFPSYREGLPVALMEAMAAGLPCVAAKNRGTDDLLEESDLLFDAGNIEELQKLICSLTPYDTSREVASNKDHLEKYDIRNTIQQIAKCYDELV
jgi:glycosyltransferase EpsD